MPKPVWDWANYLRYERRNWEVDWRISRDVYSRLGWMRARRWILSHHREPGRFAAMFWSISYSGPGRSEWLRRFRPCVASKRASKEAR